MQALKSGWTWTAVFVFVVIIGLLASHQTKSKGITVDTIYGSFDVEEPILLDLIACRGVQRLKGVHQYGVLRYATPMEEYSRYDHSVGVFALLRKFDCSVAEQVAGLLEDTSHTAFSHVADFVFDHHSFDTSYQDDIHGWYLRNSGIAGILEKYGYSVDKVHPRNGQLIALEQPLPAMCADRIEYNLQGGLRRGLLTQDEVDTLLRDLRYDEPHWYFTSVASAKKLARVSLNMTENVWGSAWGLLIYTWASDALKHALKTNRITHDDFHFSTDDAIWQRLIDSQDPVITERMNRILNFEKLFRHCDPSEQDVYVRGKFRGIDPLVKTTSGLKRLTLIDADYRKEYETVQAVMKRGWSLKVIETDGDALSKEEPLFGTLVYQ